MVLFQTFSRSEKLLSSCANAAWEYHMICHGYDYFIFNIKVDLTTLKDFILKNRVTITVTHHVLSPGFSNWPIGGIFTGMVRTFCTDYKVGRWRSQVFTCWCGKIQTDFLFSKIAVFLMYMEIYVHVFAIIKQPT